MNIIEQIEEDRVASSQSVVDALKLAHEKELASKLQESH